MCDSGINPDRFKNLLDTHQDEINKELKKDFKKTNIAKFEEDRYAVQHYSKYASTFPQADILYPLSYSDVLHEYIDERLWQDVI